MSNVPEKNNSRFIFVDLPMLLERNSFLVFLVTPGISSQSLVVIFFLIFSNVNIIGQGQDSEFVLISHLFSDHI